MTTKLLPAAPVVEHYKRDLIERCQRLKDQGIVPSMCVVLVGDNPASLSYIRNKRRLCEEVGAKFELLQLPESIQPKEFLGHIDRVNADANVHGMIVQLPVPSQLRSLNIPDLVVPHKDIDGFHGENTQKIYAGSRDLSQLMPCTPKGIINLLRFYGHEIKGKNVVVVGRSLIVGKPLSMLLTNLDATVTLAHSQTKNIREFTKQADIVIAAIGKGHFFDRSFFNPDKKTVVIDVGMNMLNGKLTGDVDTSDVLDVVSAITPVPGGVGPMTVVSLIDNLISATENTVQGTV
jgi:methylenetetrahydrofolate dehydrogenase (NADP+)/methenyltetrahydrofolate cyclohydrolase